MNHEALQYLATLHASLVDTTHKTMGLLEHLQNGEEDGSDETLAILLKLNTYSNFFLAVTHKALEESNVPVAVHIQDVWDTSPTMRELFRIAFAAEIAEIQKEIDDSIAKLEDLANG